LSKQTKEEVPATPRVGWWKRMSGPLKVGLAFALIAIIMAVIGLLRGASTAPLTVRSVVMAVVISGGTWGLISWAIATAVVEVERDVAAAEEDPKDGDEQPDQGNKS
jgi:hypothetical protein